MENNETIRGCVMLQPSDVAISSFQTCSGDAAVALRLNGVAELTMAPITALQLAAQLAGAAVAGGVYRIEGPCVSAPADVAALVAILAPAIKRLLSPQLSPPANAGELTEQTPNL